MKRVIDGGMDVAAVDPAGPEPLDMPSWNHLIDGNETDALLASIRDRIFPLGDAVRFHAGHGSGGLLGEERRLNPFAGEPALRGRFP